MAWLPIRTVTGSASGPLISPLVRVGDERRSSLQPETLRDVLRQGQGHGSGVDPPRGPSSLGWQFLAVPAVEDASVHGVLELDVRANLSHRLGLLIVAGSVPRPEPVATRPRSAERAPMSHRQRRVCAALQQDRHGFARVAAAAMGSGVAPVQRNRGEPVPLAAAQRAQQAWAEEPAVGPRPRVQQHPDRQRRPGRY